jgi:hypothetical protein
MIFGQIKKTTTAYTTFLYYHVPKIQNGEEFSPLEMERLQIQNLNPALSTTLQ